MTSGGTASAHCPDFGNADLEVGEQFEQKGLELRVCAIDLVDQQHRRSSC